METGQKVIIPVEVDALDLWRNIFGSGFETWSWWKGISYHRDTDWDRIGKVTLWIEHPDHDLGSGKTKQKTITLDVLVDAVTRCASSHYVAQALANGLDFDAVAADVVMQTAVLGEVVYG